jgi:glyoxalase family protein
MSRAILGLHHVTAISGPPQANVDFYVGTMRQRLVKRTVNFDAPDTYHLYYGDRTGSPGTILTFFPFADAGPGRAGPGMASAVAYRVPSGGLDAWMMRLAEDAIDFQGPSERFGERMIALADPDGLRIELIEAAEPSGADGAPADDGFHSVTLRPSDPAPTARVLTDLFGYEEAEREATDGTERLRFLSPAGGRGSVVDLIRSDAPPIGRQGAGTIHHVAFRAETKAVQREWRERVAAFGLDVTPVIDRQYFDSIYFREPGGVLFEIATDPPGFAADEAQAKLGTHLKLPPRYERHRAEIERVLPPIRVPA